MRAGVQGVSGGDPRKLEGGSWSMREERRKSQCRGERVGHRCGHPRSGDTGVPLRNLTGTAAEPSRQRKGGGRCPFSPIPHWLKVALAIPGRMHVGLLCDM